MDRWFLNSHSGFLLSTEFLKSSLVPRSIRGKKNPDTAGSTRIDLVRASVELRRVELLTS